MTNKNKTVLYTGVTSNLEKRVCEHKIGIIPGFKTFQIPILFYVLNNLKIKSKFILFVSL